MSSKYPHVFSPFTVRGVLFKNRLEQAPPGCFFSADDNGFVTDDFVSYFRQYARGGVAICNVGNCTIDIAESCDEPRQLQLQDPACVQPLKYFAEMCESYGAHGSLELTHNGKDTAFDAIKHPAYSASSFVTPAERMRAERIGRDPVPTIEMSKEHIRATVEKYARAALHCKQAGMKMCMVHGAHGNLIAQFASAYFNKRTDEYGGSLENRAHFACEVLDAVRAAVGENFVIEYRISAEEFHPDQMHFAETLEFIKYIRDKVDILHVSAGIHDVWGEVYWMRFMLQNYTMDRMYNVHFAAEVKKAYPDLIVATVGSIKDVAMAEEIIASGKADIVAMNRALHADYDMPRKYAEGREWEHMPCLRCRCFRMASPHTSKLCSVNAIWGRFKEYPEGRLPQAAVKKKVAVIGGGPAGVEAVKWLLQRGHDVTLYEKSGRIGGHVRDAVAAPFKQDLRDYLDYMEAFAANCGARVLLNTAATPEKLSAENYDAVIAALGADPILPKLPGADKPHVHWAPDAENGTVECGEHVAVIGGSSVGTEAAINLGMKGHQVTVLEMAKEVDLMRTGAGADLLQLSEDNGVDRRLGWRLLEILDKSVVAENVDTGEKKEFKADTVLMAVGLKPRRTEALEFCHCCPETSFIIIGDCAESGDIRDAVWSAFEAARYI
ncbi:2,4-dienoyl-CoA reductase [Sporobacter termitidis DSM 10068]|uniref:2,4-dienoyl-CoA reductase n=1 Tax=Sporobacter termitidis DSM 10068 TaxID=1123282 RepID=A0A1M5WI28_9FIRM|nr:FAD-dependent oxidoreductase [Sporobacter termitidis]SHH87180.1 2,4-dienoyl-CoA reductase [Sporobacter termitidis DSM 10068]